MAISHSDPVDGGDDGEGFGFEPDPAGVFADGLDADVELLGDLLVGHPGFEQAKDFPFARAQQLWLVSHR